MTFYVSKVTQNHRYEKFEGSLYKILLPHMSQMKLKLIVIETCSKFEKAKLTPLFHTNFQTFLQCMSGKKFQIREKYYVSFQLKAPSTRLKKSKLKRMQVRRMIKLRLIVKNPAMKLQRRQSSQLPHPRKISLKNLRLLKTVI